MEVIHDHHKKEIILQEKLIKQFQEELWRYTHSVPQGKAQLSQLKVKGSSRCTKFEEQPSPLFSVLPASNFSLILSLSPDHLCAFHPVTALP
jgi:hypothetical protein